MTRSRLVAFCAVVLTLVALPARADPPLVDTSWVKSRVGQPGMVMLDIRADEAAYAKAHVPGAVRTDYAKGGWRSTDARGAPFMLPEAMDLELLIGDLGIGNGDHVVVIAAGANALEMSAATRVYWTFKVAGHDKVSVLDGGMAAWTKDGHPLEAGSVVPRPKSFTVQLRGGILADKAAALAAMKDAAAVLVDIRAANQHLGVNKAPTVRRHGTIPGALNLPESWLTIDNSGRFRPRAELKKLAAVAGVPFDRPVIAFCNTGQLGSLGWFVLQELLGHEKATLYDGSLAEWTMDASLPLERKIDPGAP